MDTPAWELDENAAEKVLATLRNKHADESDLEMAISLADEITVINDEIINALLALARDDEKTEDIRGAAVIALGPVLEYVEMLEEIDEPVDTLSKESFHALRKELRKLYMDAELPKEVRRRTLEASVRAPMGWHKWDVKAAWPHVEGIIEDRDADPEILLAAIDALINLRPQKAHLLLPLTESEDEDVVAAAHEAFAMIEALREDGFDME